jgi:hypothetical protein
MPNRWPVQNGNWSNQSIWSGSIIPNEFDDVFLNNRVVTLDQNIQVISINNAASASAITAGGRIEIYGNFNISASVIRSSTNTSTDPTGTGPGLISFYGTGSSTITARLNSGSGETGPTVFNGSTGTFNIIGNVWSPNGTRSTAVVNSTTGVINIIGNVTGLQNMATFGVLNSYGTINITGNVTGGSNNQSSPVIENRSAGILNITGNVFGCPFGFVSSAVNTISHGSANAVNITGNVQGIATPGIASSVANTINIVGQCIASISSSAVTSTSTTATNIFSGPLINSGSRNAIYCYNVQMYKNATTSYRIGVSGSNDIITLLSEDQAPGMPITTNVRSGVIYGPTNALTGRMAVPDPRSVSWGVAVDNTTGSAIVKPEDIWNYTLTSLTSSNSIGQRLASTATSASNASIANAFSN